MSPLLGGREPRNPDDLAVLKGGWHTLDVTQSVQLPPPGFENLSSEEKLAYVRRLWAEVVSVPDGVALTAGQQAELDRRLDAHRADPSAARPWSEVRTELRAKYGPRE